MAPRGSAHTESEITQLEGTAGLRQLPLASSWPRRAVLAHKQAVQILGNLNWQVQQIWPECFLEKTSPQVVSLSAL